MISRKFSHWLSARPGPLKSLIKAFEAAALDRSGVLAGDCVQNGFYSVLCGNLWNKSFKVI